MADKCGGRLMPCYLDIKEHIQVAIIFYTPYLCRTDTLLDIIGELLLILNDCIEEMEHTLEELEKQKEELW